MSIFPASLPSNKKELFTRLRAIIAHGWYKMPKVPRYNGTGGPGNFAEDLCGAKAGNQSLADATGWDLKSYQEKTGLITLFHKEAQPQNIMRYMVSKWGWKDAQGRLSFRHTISGKSDRFRVVDDGGQVIVRPLVGNGPVPYWTHDDILNAASKLRSLVLVKFEREGDEVRFVQADCFEQLHISFFVYELERGTIAIDFDCREAKAGSKGLRNHGTKFRISPLNVCRMYMKKERFSA